VRNAEVPREASASSTTTESYQYARVVRVVDGDTVEIEGGQKVRYIGINTPESVDPRREIQCFGKEASEENRRLVEGKTVRLEKDISETDKYGRLLRYVYVDSLFINDALVRTGFAHASTYPPDVMYASLLNDAQNVARDNKSGLWSHCPLK
jgi:micrococcal nuclease